VAVDAVPARSELAPAKVNLTLRVIGRRPDGYHDIESLVVFAALGDSLTFTPGPTLVLDVRGPTATAAGAIGDNLVLKAANALAAGKDDLRLGRFVLSKRLPAAAGVGGGSSDAAAALRLLARANHIGFDDPALMAAARATGADVPVCLDPRPRIMRGIGDVLSPPLDLPRLPAVLVNPRIAVPTKDVFAKLAAPPSADGMSITAPALSGVDDLMRYLAAERNDLEAPAISLQPVIAGVLASLGALRGCRLARMSGSGATCFALFETSRAAVAAAHTLRSEHPDWWVRATVLG
jgi:4-diphosphocytidyl-2-C-methyl-D-erythritol kinase